MEKTIVITGLSRAPKIFWLPLGYFLAVCFLTMVPMMLMDLVAWLLTAPLWWMSAWVVTRVNPHAHVVLWVLWRKFGLISGVLRVLVRPAGGRRHAA